jgi:hypothetical protein
MAKQNRKIMYIIFLYMTLFYALLQLPFP